jgi:hypothetical protein
VECHKKVAVLLIGVDLGEQKKRDMEEKLMSYYKVNALLHIVIGTMILDSL